MNKRKIISLILALTIVCSFFVIQINAASPYAVVLPDPDIGGGTLDLPTGTYFIRNYEYDKVMQIDDDVSPSTSGAHMELWDLNGADYQKWYVYYLGNGYYSITSVASGLALSVPSGYNYSADVSLIQESYNIQERQQWSIEQTSRGTFVLRPHSGENDPIGADWCMAAGSGMFTSDGRNVEQRGYSNNTTYIDEWEFEPLGDYVINFCGIPDGRHDHSSSLETAKEELRTVGLYNVTLHTGDILPITCLEYLTTSNIFTSRSHGIEIRDSAQNVISTAIVLNDLSNNSITALYSHPCSQMSSVSMNITSTDSFDNLDLVLFIGCTTAAGGATGNNLPAVAVANGATVAIGFPEEINCGDANDWTEDFYSSFVAGNTVEQAVNHANSRQESDSTLRLAVIVGNSNYTIDD